MCKFKKSVSVILALLLSLSVCAVFPVTAGAITSGDYEYEVFEDIDEDGNTYSYASIIEYTGADAEVTIPDTLGGYPVQTISEYSFCSEELTSLTIPASVTSFDNTAFLFCSNLQSVTVAEGNPTYCSVDSVIYSKDKSSLMFYPAGNDTADFVIPDGVSEVGCPFSNCQNLVSITIPTSVSFFSTNEIYGCTNLSAINVSENNEYYSSQDGVLFDKQKTELVYYPQGKEGESYTIPNGVLTIGSKAFYECNTISSITIPESVTMIDNEAFYACYELSEINFPSYLESIGAYALDDTAWLENQPDGVVYVSNVLYRYKGEATEPIDLVIEDGTTVICENAFAYCDFISSVTIPESMQSIDSYAFAFCYELTTVNFNAVSCQMYSDSFAECENLTTVVFGSSVTSISGSAFADCYSLSNITIPDSVTYVGNSAFFNTPWYEAQSDGIVYAGRVAYSIKGELQDGAAVSFKDGTVTIGDFLFEYMPISSVTFPDSVKTIGYGSFMGCTGLTKLDLPSSLELIDESAFEGCTGLTELVIPKSVSEIGSRAFFDCIGLTGVTVSGCIKSIGEYALGYYFDYDNYDYATTDGFTVSGYVCTAAMDYANENSLVFKSLPTEIDGDLNGDGSVTLLDAIIAMRASVELISFDEQGITNADMNKDGKVSVYDAIMIQRLSF